MNKAALGVAAASLICAASCAANAANIKDTGHVIRLDIGDACAWAVLDSVPLHFFTVSVGRLNHEAMEKVLLTAYDSEAKAQRQNNNAHGDLLTIEHAGIPDDGCYEGGGSWIIDLSMVPK